MGAWLCSGWSANYLVDEETTLAEFADNPNPDLDKSGVEYDE